MNKSRDVNEWLKRAKSNLSKSKLPKTEEMYYEDFCFDCQQCAEKALKALIIKLGLKIERTHSFEVILAELKKRIQIPEHILDVLDLSDYAVMTRYPDDFVEVTKEEHEKAVEIAERVYNWVKDQIN